MNNRINLIAILVIAVFTSITAQGTSPEHEAYLGKYKDIAIREMQRTGIPASITLAQALLESGAGKSSLARTANNHFGIKCGGEWCGEVYYKEDDDRNASGTIIPSCFRSYNSAEQSFVDHSNFLKNPKKSRYDFLFELDPTDYKAWARGLKRAGYATNPKYPAKLISLIERYRLYQYDQPVVAQPVVETNRPTQDAPLIIVGNQPEQTPVENNRKTRTTYHTVQRGETMADIAQDYGIALFWLNHKNRMKEGMQPARGSRVKLTGPRVSNHPNLAREGEEAVVENEEFIIWTEEGGTDTEPVRVQLPNNGTVTQDNQNTAQSDSRPPNPDWYDDENGKTSIQNNATQTTHTVQSGETLWSISQKYDMKVDDLKRRNRLSNNTISVDQVIVLH